LESSYSSERLIYRTVSEPEADSIARTLLPYIILDEPSKLTSKKVLEAAVATTVQAGRKVSITPDMVKQQEPIQLPIEMVKKVNVEEPSFYNW